MPILSKKYLVVCRPSMEKTTNDNIVILVGDAYNSSTSDITAVMVCTDSMKKVSVYSQNL